MKTILLTGCLGRIGRITSRHLADNGYDVRGLDICASPNDEGVLSLDLRDAEQVETALKGVDAVIHLAASLAEDDWEDILQNNIVATYNLYEGVRKAGVRRVLLASSHHVIGMYSTDQELNVSDPPRPDSLYGLSKCFSEDLARYYFDKFGVETIAVRIGAMRPAPEIPREYSIWLSPADWCRIVDLALEIPNAGSTVIWGVSDNLGGWWGNPSDNEIGYRPLDRAGAMPENVRAKSDPDDPAVYLQGGKRAAFRLGER